MREQPWAPPASVEPWYRATVGASAARFAELESDRTGAPAASDGPWALTKAMTAGTRRDPSVLRMLLEVAGVLALPAEVFARPGAVERVRAAGGDAPRYPLPGPERSALLAAAASSGKPHSGPLRP